MDSQKQNWEEGPFVVGATYRVIQENMCGRLFTVGEKWVFWYKTYSRYDSLDFLFFVKPENFYPPAGTPLPTELKDVDGVGWELSDSYTLEHWYEFWELLEAPRPGRMWVLEAAERQRAESRKQYEDQLRYLDERTQPPQPPAEKPIWKKKPKK